MPELTLEQRIQALEKRVQELEDKQPVKKFIKPKIEEVQSYMIEKGLVGTPAFIIAEATKYMNHYTSNGWKVGKTSMKDWKAAVRTWIGNIKEGVYNGKNITGNYGRKPFGKNDGAAEFGGV